MSILRSYINKNNTITSNSYVNTGRNPIVELNFGASNFIVPNYGFTRFLFDLDLDLLRENIASGVISTGCATGMTHSLFMTNTSSFDNELLNSYMSNERRRATSFDLILFRIPKTSSLVRGEELLELINMIVRFLVTHTHAYPGLPPVSVTQDGSNIADMLTELQNAATKILNNNIRLN